MDDHNQAVLLFDFYGDLLTDRQRTAYGMYYNDNLSLSEIAEELSVTRQGARDAVQRAADSLRVYEAKLGLVSKHNERARLIESIIGDAQKLTDSNNLNEYTYMLIQKIQLLSEV